MACDNLFIFYQAAYLKIKVFSLDVNELKSGLLSAVDSQIIGEHLLNYGERVRGGMKLCGHAYAKHNR